MALEEESKVNKESATKETTKETAKEELSLEEKKRQLIMLEWAFFQDVQNEGGRASCQDDPETFCIMRGSQFDAWPASVIDSYLADLLRAQEDERNPVMEKYAWMMKDTAPERFKEIQHLLPGITPLGGLFIDIIVNTQLEWMEEYIRKYPYLAAGNRVARKEQAGPHDTSFETYLRGELSTYSEGTLKVYSEFVEDLRRAGENLILITMDNTVRNYGYDGLDDAEKRKKESA